MPGKRRCNNCGAFLDETERVCYVCGEKQEIDIVSSSQIETTERESKMKFEKDEDFVLPTSSNDEGRTQFEDRVPYDDEDVAEPYYESDEKSLRAQKKRNIKAAVIAGSCVLAAAVIGLICVLIFGGGFGGDSKPDNKIKIYFDKPMSDIELKTKSGDVYKWSDDVEVDYVINDKEKTKKCTLCEDHESLWEVELSVEAKSIYFYESSDKKVRTQVLPSFEEEMVYYVSQEEFNSQDQLPIGMCARESFEGIGINYATTAETSESTSAETSEQTKETTKNTEETTKSADDSRKTVDNGIYTVSLPKSWQSGVTAVKNGKCTTYYEDYNYNMYYMGKLASIYVFDANDSAADNLTGVKDIRYNSDQTKKIVITTPTDVQFNEADEKAQEEYLKRNKDLYSFLDSISVE